MSEQTGAKGPASEVRLSDDEIAAACCAVRLLWNLQIYLGRSAEWPYPALIPSASEADSAEGFNFSNLKPPRSLIETVRSGILGAEDCDMLESVLISLSHLRCEYGPLDALKGLPGSANALSEKIAPAAYRWRKAKRARG